MVSPPDTVAAVLINVLRELILTLLLDMAQACVVRYAATILETVASLTL